MVGYTVSGRQGIDGIWGLQYLDNEGNNRIAGIVLGGIHALQDASLGRRSDLHGDGGFAG